jgi:cold shock CspA family protein
MTGKVLVFWPYKHFGFIKEQSTLQEIFFHTDNLVPGSPLPEKDSLVSYEIGKRADGRTHAINLRVLPSSQGGAS